MENYAMVHTAKGFVANVILWDGGAGGMQAPEGYEMVAIAGRFCGPGCLYEGGEFIPVPGMVPADQPAAQPAG
jgi:hypothetical protein